MAATRPHLALRVLGVVIPAAVVGAIWRRRQRGR